MGKYFVKRLGMAILTIFLVACLTFLLMNAVPGSPWLSEKTPSETTLAALNAKYGLDKPVYVQLFMYLKNILHGDFGVSLKMQKNRCHNKAWNFHAKLCCGICSSGYTDWKQCTESVSVYF